MILSFCITCLNRAEDLKRTLPRNLEDNMKHKDKVEFVLMDFNTPGVKEWVLNNFKEELESGYLKYFVCDGLKEWNASVGKNTAHKYANGNILFNLDCDNFTGNDCGIQVIELMRQFGGNILLHHWDGDFKSGSFGRICYWKKHFNDIRGYDEGNIIPVVTEDVDIIVRILYHHPNVYYATNHHMIDAFLKYKIPNIHRRVIHLNGKFHIPIPVPIYNNRSDVFKTVKTNNELKKILAGDFKHKYQDTDEYGLRVRRDIGKVNAEYTLKKILVDKEIVANLDKNIGLTAYPIHGKPLNPNIKIFQIGFNKCGTCSINTFFNKNGVNGVHWDNGHLAQVLKDNIESGSPNLLGKYSNYTFFSDMEYVSDNEIISVFTDYYEILDKKYPNSKFIFNTRDVNNWIKSRVNHWDGKYIKHFMEYYNLSYNGVIEKWITQWNTHKKKVMNYFANRPDDLLVYDIERDRPEKICNFLSQHFSLNPKFFYHINKTPKEPTQNSKPNTHKTNRSEKPKIIR